ncbi:helix-turn-helix transcriptional regulator [Telluribacter humicola]|uniref:helix-turn-helix transcriptional regulator n=1 Tax=Telluribacter humicola TaxID=1720261 RepID=UPI001A9605B4|nr:AraC family transcriptional regulator [Telluribacter humicola]
MQNLTTGQFYGQTNETIRLGGITLTETEYTQEKVDWHYHENAYFTFILEGQVVEGNKKEIYHCGAGSLLFHNWQEAHYNIKPPGFTRGFHIELEHTWFKALDINFEAVEGSLQLQNPELKLLLYRIFRETKINDTTSSLAIQTLLLETLGRLAQAQETMARQLPTWVPKIRDMLHDTSSESWNLQALAQTLDIHPVHLSRDFSKYFNCTLGEYIRRIKIQKSLALLPDRSLSLTDIAYACGFADQSHFIRCFKNLNATTPFHFRNLFDSHRPC